MDENAEVKAEKKIKQSSANTSSVENPNNIVHLGKLEKMAKPSNTSDSTFNSNACKPIHIETNCITDLSMTSTGLVTPSEQVIEKSIPKESSAESAIPFNADLTLGSVFHLAHLFDKAEKTGQKEKLRWYYYSEEYEKKIVTLRFENNISDQMVRTQIYNEMELYLPGKKREYLRKMTQKAKNIYTLFKGIGIDKIGVVTSSADAISRLTDA
ncbi:13776_t:CDS:2 [Funneliformis geosporum]|nr:13776_t:CDS:2 [Funneliformis geosporum]